MIKLSRWLPIAIGSKNHDNCASAGSPIDFVLGNETVKVPQNFISVLKLKRIDFGGRLRNCPDCGRQLIKPTELCFVLFLNCLRSTNLSRYLKFVKVIYFIVRVNCCHLLSVRNVIFFSSKVLPIRFF